MKKSLVVKLLVVSALLALLSAPVAFAYGGSGGACQKCTGGYDPSTRTAVVSCSTPTNGDWGSVHCDITCITTKGPDDGLYYGTCSCTDSAEQCLYIEVTPNWY